MTTLTAILAAVLASLLGAVVAYFRGIRSGRNSEIVKKAQADEKLRTQFDQIDSDAPDLDDALGRLRSRAAPDSKPASK